MKIQWLGHSCFLITTSKNIRIITDPYNTVNGVNYDPIKASADIVTISHDHYDHNNASVIKGNPVVLSDRGTHSVQHIRFRTIPVFHDEAGGIKRGTNLIFCFKTDGLNICHLGDLGHTLTRQQLSEIGPVDILFIPTGGYYTIDAVTASQVSRDINPKVIIPMHHKTPKLDFPVDGVEKFIDNKKNVKIIQSFEINIEQNSFPESTIIIVLQPAN